MNVQGVEPYGTTTSSSCITELNKSKRKQPNADLVKREVVESDDVQLETLQREVRTIKTETVSTKDDIQFVSFNSLEPEVSINQSLELKSEKFDEICYADTYEKISIKEEFSHEELNTPAEDETIEEASFDKDNSGIQLQKSMVTSIRLKPFRCHICEYSCARSSGLQSHLRTHTGEKPLKCNICNKNFGEKTTLKNHLRTHTGEKPFKCHICEYSCSRNSGLQSHLRKHTGEKPFKCYICNYSFTIKWNLTRHKRTHTGVSSLN